MTTRKTKKIYCKSSNNYGSDILINKFLSIQNNISEYEFINIKKYLELKNN